MSEDWLVGFTKAGRNDSTRPMTLRLPVDLHEHYRQQAFDLRTSMSALIVAALYSDTQTVSTSPVPVLGENGWRLGRLNRMSDQSMWDDDSPEVKAAIDANLGVQEIRQRLRIPDSEAIYSQTYFDEHTQAAYLEGAADVIREVDRVMPGPGPRGKEGWKNRLVEKFGLVEE